MRRWCGSNRGRVNAAERSRFPLRGSWTSLAPMNMRSGFFAAIMATSISAPVVARAEAPAPMEAAPQRGPYPGAVTVGFDAGVLRRTTLWRDDLFGALRDYKLGAAPILGIEVAFFPGALFTPGRAGWVGLVGRVEGAVGIDSRRTQHDASLPTQAGAFSLALRGRMPLRVASIWIDGGIASRTFIINSEGGTVPDFPSVRYIGPRVSVGGQFKLPRHFSVGSRFGLARWTSAGDLSSAAWFPHMRAWGVDLAVRVGVMLPLGIEPYVDLGWSRDVSALRPQPGEARVAGGLADDRLTARAGFSMTFPSPAR